MDAFLGTYLGVYNTEYYYLCYIVLHIDFSIQVKGALPCHVIFEFNIVQYSSD